MGDAFDEAKDRRVAYINVGVWALLTLLLCCGGAVVSGLFGSHRESDGVDAAMIATGPACCAVAGLLGALPGLFAFEGKTGLKIGLPIALGILGGLLGAVGVVVFFEAIWPSL